MQTTVAAFWTDEAADRGDIVVQDADRAAVEGSGDPVLVCPRIGIDVGSGALSALGPQTKQIKRTASTRKSFGPFVNRT